MGKQWKTASKLTQANKKGALFTKLSREIQVAVRLSGANPENNSRLKLALESARSYSLSKDTIERAILKASGQLAGEIIEEITYEGFGPHGVAIIIPCLTDNRTRTVSEIRFLFKKHNGIMGESGSVMWMFNKVALIKAHKKLQNNSVEVEAINADADDVESAPITDTHDINIDTNINKNIFLFYGAWSKLQVLQNNLQKQDWTILKAEVAYRAKNKITLTPTQQKDIQILTELFYANKDCKSVYTNI